MGGLLNILVILDAYEPRGWVAQASIAQAEQPILVLITFS